MTKAELIEDVKQGDIIKIYTESNEVFEGKVIDFGESGLKIHVLDSKKIKRVMYGRISEYDVEDIESNELSIDSNSNDIEEKNKNEVIDCNREDINKSHSDIETKKEVFFLDRKNIFNECHLFIDLETIKSEWIEKLDSKQKNEYIRITNIINYAKKVHEYSLNSDRIKRAIIECKKMANNIKIMNVFIAFIYHEFNDIENAIKYYSEAGAWDVAFQLSLKYGFNDNLFEYAILAVKYNAENKVIIKWLCEYAVNNNDSAVISYIINHSKDFLGEILLFWYVDKPEIKLLPDLNDIFVKENITYLKNLSVKIDDENNEHIKTILSNISSSSNVATGNDLSDKSKIYQGVISYYNKNGGNGTIKNSEGGSIYFYIKQVKDLRLQRILATESDYKKRVVYTRGVNFKGEIAADAIEMMEIDSEELTENEYTYEGFFDDYDIYESRGRIRSGNKIFNFVFEAIKDPLLYAEMMSRPYSVLDLSVKFNARNYKSKKTKKSSQIAFDICGVKKYSQSEIDEFISQRYVTKAEVNEWLGINKITGANTGYFRATEYEPLREIGFVVKEEAVDKRLMGVKAETKKLIESTNGEKRAVSILLDSDADNPFSDLKRDRSGMKYFQQAHRYMVGRKNTNGEIVGVDLDKAEKLFIQSIMAMDQTNSSVANLVNIYIKRGGEYIVKGLQLLEEYGYLFPTEKLTNLRIQLIDKSGNFDALEQILLSAIPNCVKKNTVWQYMVKLAGIYYKQQRWDNAIEWFEKSLSYLEKNKTEFAQYRLLHMNNLRPLIIANYTAGYKENAISQAKKFLLIAPDDLVVRSIVDGSFEVNKSKIVLEDIDDVELQYEDDLLDIVNSEMPAYLNDKIQKVDLSSTFSKVPIVYEKIQNGRYMGNADDSNKAVKQINNNLLRKNKRGISAEVRRAIFIGIARIISDSRENSSSSNEGKVALDEVKRYVARYARYSADVLVEKCSTVDSIRFLYILALRYLGDGDDGNINVALNMLIASFFMDSTKLPDELHNMGNSVHKDSYYKMNCISVKDLLIAS